MFQADSSHGCMAKLAHDAYCTNVYTRSQPTHHHHHGLSWKEIHDPHNNHIVNLVQLKLTAHDIS